MNLNTSILFAVQVASYSWMVVRYIELYVKRPKHQELILKRIVEEMEKNPNSVISADDILLTEQYKVELGNGTLAALGNFATIVGLLGTVIGMVKSFGSLSDVMSAAQKVQILKDGIADSLFCTGYGLIVAVPPLIAYAIYSNRANVLMDRLNKDSMKAYLKILSRKAAE